MKKKLEAELISIAHRILKLKNKSELDQLYSETQALYEKLAVLKFAESHFGDAKPTIGIAEVEAALDAETPEPEPTPAEPEAVKPEPAEPLVEGNIEAQEEAVEKESHVQPEAEASEEVVEETTEEVSAEVESEETEETPEAEASEEPETESASAEEEATEEAEPQSEEEIVSEAEKEAIAESESETESTSEETPVEPTSASEHELPKTTEDELFKPVFEWNFEPKEASPEVAESKEPQSQINFDDLLSSAYKHPEFVKPEENLPAETPKESVIPIDRAGDKVQVIKMTDEPIDRSVSLNDRLSRGITVGLNDRIAFVKHLFNNSNEDYNRVLSQLITLDTLEQAKDFIDNMVKPDYNNWEGKDEYSQRFMEVVEKKFS